LDSEADQEVGPGVRFRTIEPGTGTRYDLFQKEDTKMPENRIRVAPNTVAYADEEKHKLVMEFAIPGAPTDTIDLKILPDTVHLTAPARDVEYVSAQALAWQVKPDQAEAIYAHGLLRVEVPFKDPMEDAVKVAIKAGGAEIKTQNVNAGLKPPPTGGGAD
jgi:HSP20 family molecular chaperone IbpA